jgi:hypothetical protein
MRQTAVSPHFPQGFGHYPINRQWFPDLLIALGFCQSARGFKMIPKPPQLYPTIPKPPQLYPTIPKPPQLYPSLPNYTQLYPTLPLNSPTAPPHHRTTAPLAPSASPTLPHCTQLIAMGSQSFPEGFQSMQYNIIRKPPFENRRPTRTFSLCI